MISSNGEVCGSKFIHHNFQIHLFFDMPGNKKFTHATISLRSSAIGLIYNGAHMAPGTFKSHLFVIVLQDYTLASKIVLEKDGSWFVFGFLYHECLQLFLLMVLLPWRTLSLHLRRRDSRVCCSDWLLL